MRWVPSTGHSRPGTARSSTGRSGKGVEIQGQGGSLRDRAAGSARALREESNQGREEHILYRLTISAHTVGPTYRRRLARRRLVRSDPGPRFCYKRAVRGPNLAKKGP